MKKKNGFISTSIIYSFFLVFVTLFLGLILNYMHNRVLLNRINEAAYNDIDKMLNARLSNLNVGDYVLFELKTKEDLADDEEPTDLLNNVPYILVHKDGNKLEFYSYVELINSRFNNNTDYLYIDRLEELLDTDIKNAYKYTDIANSFDPNIVTTSSLKRVRESITDINILDDIYDFRADYVIYNDIDYHSNWWNPNYKKNEYYKFRKYSLTSPELEALFANPDDINKAKLDQLLSTYCNISYNDSITYNSKNEFGYANILSATINKPKYINYCYNSQFTNYYYNADDKVVPYNESGESDMIDNDDKLNNQVNQKELLYRISLEVELPTEENKDYFIGGKGTKEDPYVLRTGGKS